MRTIVNTTLLCLGLMTLGNSSFAQDRRLAVGSRFGIGESKIDLSGSSDEKSKIAFTAGISSAYHFNRFLGVGADFMFTSRGGNYFSYSSEQDVFGNEVRYDYKDQYNIYSLDVPLALKLRLPLSDNFALKAFAGPNFQFTLLGNETRRYSDPEYDADNGYFNRQLQELNAMEYAFQYGLGLEVGGGNAQTFFMDFRVNQSLSNLGKIQGQNASSSNYLISIGYLF